MPLDPITARIAHAKKLAREAPKIPPLNPPFPYQMIPFDPFVFDVAADPPPPPPT